MQVDWIRRLGIVIWGLPRTRSGDLFKIKRRFVGWHIGWVSREGALGHTLEAGDLVLVLDATPDRMGLIKVSVNSRELKMEAHDLWDHGKLIG